MSQTLFDTTDIEQIANLLSNSGFHFGLTRTRNAAGMWECRIWPSGAVAESMIVDRDFPYGRADTYQQAIRKAIDGLPKELGSLFDERP